MNEDAHSSIQLQDLVVLKPTLVDAWPTINPVPWHVKCRVFRSYKRPKLKVISPLGKLVALKYS
jgi:hypothetical protein